MDARAGPRHPLGALPIWAARETLRRLMTPRKQTLRGIYWYTRACCTAYTPKAYGCGTYPHMCGLRFWRPAVGRKISHDLADGGDAGSLPASGGEATGINRTQQQLVHNAHLVYPLPAQV